MTDWVYVKLVVLAIHKQVLFNVLQHNNDRLLLIRVYHHKIDVIQFVRLMLILDILPSV